MPVQLIADSGATKCEWCLVNNGKKKTFFTAGISPYFLNSSQIVNLLQTEILPQLENAVLDEVHFYGTGLGNPDNVIVMREAMAKIFFGAKINAHTDLLAAARALYGSEKGIACILGTGSNACYYDGENTIQKTISLGYVLADEGSGSHLGKKVLQHYLNNIFDEYLRSRFDAMFVTTPMEILENLYKKPFPNRYLGSFAVFLSDNRGHYMAENILEDCFNEFFSNQLNKYTSEQPLPVSFAGSIAFAFKDVLQDICSMSELEPGLILKNPMEGLVKYHSRLL